MKIGIVGLGLIGGSIAKAIKKKTEHEIVAWDKDENICANAMLLEAADAIMPNGSPKECDLVIIALYPSATIAYVKAFQDQFKKDSLVIDCAGVKQEICKELEEVANRNQFLFCGAHPMAGIERSGFTYSSAELFEGATMILTPPHGSDIARLNDLSLFLKSIGFARMQISTPKEHDEMIAYTSQLAHIVSSAYIKNELATKFKGFSAGSFKDMTRVAKLNENMWTELFLENSEFLGEEVDLLIQRLQEYKIAIQEKDANTLKALLKEGKELRMSVDEAKEFD